MSGKLTEIQNKLLNICQSGTLISHPIQRKSSLAPADDLAVVNFFSAFLGPAIVFALLGSFRKRRGMGRSKSKVRYRPTFHGLKFSLCNIGTPGN